MRDDSQRWDPPQTKPVIVASDSVRVTQMASHRQVLVSGHRALQATELPLIGWPGDCTTTHYALVLRRDRILEVNGPARVDGWDGQLAIAVSTMSSGYAMLEIEGSGALGLLRHGGFVEPGKPSRSVTATLFDLPVLLYRRSPGEVYIVHVSRPYVQTIRQAIQRFAPKDRGPNR